MTVTKLTSDKSSEAVSRPESASPSSLGTIQVSAIAKALGSILTQANALTEIQQAAYRRQTELVEIQKDLSLKQAEFVLKEGKQAARATELGAIGSIVQGSVGGLTIGAGAASYVKSRIDLKPTIKAEDVARKNQMIFEEEGVKSKTDLTVNKTAPTTARDIPTVKADLQKKIAGDEKQNLLIEKVNKEDVAALAADKAAYNEVKKSLDDKQSKLSSDIRREEEKQNMRFNMANGLGQSLGALGNGVTGKYAAEAKEIEAEAAKEKTLYQSNQSMHQSIVDNGYKAINSFDSAREAVSRAHAEIAASNRA